MSVKPFVFALTITTVSPVWLSAWSDTEPIAPDTDLARLQGRWTARAGARREVRVALQIDGRQVKAAISTPQGIRFQLRGELRLEETTSPRNLDWIKFTGADQQEFPSILAIYKIDGDTFTICNGGLNGPRPKEFKSGEGVLAEVITFDRDRKAK